MKLLLLFDQHLSYKLLARLKDLYPDSKHQSDDIDIWKYAKDNGFTIVTKDIDFYELGLVKGYPPKIIWLRCGNTSTNHIEKVLRDNFPTIEDFILNLPQICLELY